MIDAVKHSVKINEAEALIKKSSISKIIVKKLFFRTAGKNETQAKNSITLRN